MTTPTTRPTSISGAETSTSVMIASRATSRTSGPVMTTPALPTSDRHPHDLFVSRDHLVAHRNQRLDRHLGFAHRGHHVDDVGLPGRHPLREPVRLAAR